MGADPVIELRRYRHEDLSVIRQTLLDVHALIPEYPPDDPFDQRFPWFVDHWGKNPDFTCVIGYDRDQAVGFAYGAPLNDGREWWRDHLEPAPEKSRTYAVSELMVRPEWRKKGVSDRLHQALLADVKEDIAVLLVDSAHPKVQARYESWGYQKVGERQPFADSPKFSVMIKPLNPTGS
ncbi:GNAT family N-acetyltransferase [Streptomyces sp. NBC_01142]|uniref:GNAT family N-acetyltransferase n=1 Tax=Streptomyces sp. NBC_01142 TaxID=2975865 RepID=UPI0022505B6A|nr:GNAT family N-acetyltransferase [Streptomyces sp. NBC_01142]MCX4819464.1 GNAT family N-acetyltransferase [Streptomyces sp. NBC_01142]